MSEMVEVPDRQRTVERHPPVELEEVEEPVGPDREDTAERQLQVVDRPGQLFEERGPSVVGRDRVEDPFELITEQDGLALLLSEFRDGFRVEDASVGESLAKGGGWSAPAT